MKKAIIALVLVIAMLSSVAMATTSKPAPFIPDATSTVFTVPGWAIKQFGEDIGLKLYDDPKRETTRKEFAMFLLDMAVSGNDHLVMSVNWDSLKKFDDFESEIANLSDAEKIALATLVDKGVLKGNSIEDKLFLNHSSIVTRGEATAILRRFSDKKLLTFTSDTVAKNVFSDVPETHWAYDSIYWASTHALFDGNNRGEFSPNSGISLIETLKLGYNLTKSDKDISIFNFCVVASSVFKVTTYYANNEVSTSKISLDINAIETVKVEFALKNGDGKKASVTSSDPKVATASIASLDGNLVTVKVTGITSGTCEVIFSTGNEFTQLRLKVTVTASSGGGGGGSSGGGGDGGGGDTEIEPTPPGKGDVVVPPPEDPGTDDPIQPIPPTDGDVTDPGIDDPEVPEQPTPPSPPEEVPGNPVTPPDDEGIAPPDQGLPPTPPGDGDVVLPPVDEPVVPPVEVPDEPILPPDQGTPAPPPKGDVVVTV